MIGLDNVLQTFTIMMVLTALIVFVITVIRFLPKKGNKDPKGMWENIRMVIIMLPLAYIFLNIGESANDISDVLFVALLPLVLVMILALGIIELCIPFLSQVKRYTSGETQRVMSRGRRRRR